MKNFYQVNKKYIDAFYQNVKATFANESKKSDISFLRSILIEINNLFKKFGGQLSDKTQIMGSKDYPDSSQYNILLTNIAFDIDKLYNSHALIEEDINNLINFNSYQRDQALNYVQNLQQSIESAFIKSKAAFNQGSQKTETFDSLNNLGSESNNVQIDLVRKVLTLASTSNTIKPVDVNETQIYVNGYATGINPYPNSSYMAPASHWLKESNDVHFVDVTNQSILQTYKAMMIDDPNNPQGVGICEFESVITLPGYGGNDILSIVKKDISDQTHKSAIYMDKINSLQGKYIINDSVAATDYKLPSSLKLVIPFIGTVLTNEVVVDFAASTNGSNAPTIDWSKSYAYSIEGTPHGLIEVVGTNTNSHSCLISSFINIGRLEILLNITDQLWESIPFAMAHYVYNDMSNTSIPLVNGVTLLLSKIYDVYVDFEPNTSNESTRASNVLKGT